jgi:hypothetical protein
MPEAGGEALEALDPAWLGGAARLPLNGQPMVGWIVSSRSRG